MICNACGSEVPDQSKFCMECGAPLVVTPAKMPGVDDASSELDQIGAEGEYRHITVMFVDLVGSTRLSEQLSPEAYRHLILRYFQIAVEPIGRYGGFVARYLGDGILVYFGYPNSYEDNAMRACHAAIEIHEGLATKGGEVFRESGVRIGIHSDRVLISGVGKHSLQEDHTIFGRAPNLAARLQAEADVHQTLISQETFQLIDNSFETTALGQRLLKGIGSEVAIHALDGRQVRRAAPSTEGPVPLIEREAEQDRLMQIWNGLERFSVVAVTEQIGIGKTALIEWFLAMMPEENKSTMVMTCSPYEERSPFAAIARALDQITGADLLQDPADRPASYDAYFDEIGLASDDARSGLKFIAGIEDSRISQTYAEDPEGLRSYMSRGLQLLLKVLSSKGPLLILLENGQWADPSTIDTLHRLTISLRDAPIMLVIVARGNASALTLGRDVPLVSLDLNPLSSDGIRAAIRELDTNQTLSPSEIEQIALRSDGIPLFVRELTRATLDPRDAIMPDGSRGQTDQVDPTPSTLADALTSRMENLGSGWSLAQAASVIGRRFTFDGLNALVRRPTDSITADLNKMIAADVITPEVNALEVAYQFRLTLFQSIAYESLLSGKRRELHDRYLGYVEGLDDPFQAEKPERLAEHARLADRILDAVRYLKLSGERAAARSSLSEAVGYFKEALDVLEEYPGNLKRDHSELSILVRLGGCLVNLEGAGAPETVAIYKRAVALCDELEVTPDHLAAYWGWWFTAERLDEMEERSNRVIAVARSTDVEAFHLQAHHCAWGTTFQLGHHEQCLGHIEEGLKLYESVGREDQARLFGGHDTAVCGLGEAGLANWLTGKVAKSAISIQQALDRADRLQHIGSCAHALDYALTRSYYARDVSGLDRHVNRFADLAERYQLPDVSAKLQIFNGWANVERGQAGVGLTMIRDGMEVMRDLGGFEDFPIYISMEAEALLALGHGPEMRRVLTEGDEVEAALAYKYWAGELYRLRALSETLAGTPAGAEASFDQALDLTKSQGAHLLSLRILTTRLEKTGDSGAGAEHIRNLEEALNAIEETRLSPDVARARKVLEALSK